MIDFKEKANLIWSDTVSIEDAFPGYADNPLGLDLRGACYREGLTQRQLAEATGIPQRHISELRGRQAADRQGKGKEDR